MLIDALQALEAWPLAGAIRTSTLTYPLLNGSHILSFGVLIGALLVHHLRLLGVTGGAAPADISRAAVPIAAVALVMALLSGFLLFATRATEYAQNAAFLTKTGLIAAALLNAVFFHTLARGRMAAASVIASAALWIGALFAGRWIGFLV